MVLSRMLPDISIIVAVYNEDPRNLFTLIERVREALRPTGMTHEVIFVNDGSREKTSSALRKLAADFDHVKLLELSRNFGQQAAISAGLDHSDGSAVVNIDSDLQDPPELIPEMIKRWKEGFDVVYAQRSTRRDRFGKRFSAYLFYRLLGSISSVEIPWDTGDFRLMDRKVIAALQSLPEKTRFLRGMIPWLGFKQIGIPINRDAREVGESTYTLRKLIQLALDGILSFSSAPLYALPPLGGILVALGVISFVAALLIPSELQHVILIGALLAVFTGVQIACTGVVAVYVSKALDESRGRPTYIVAARLGMPFAQGRADSDSSVDSFDPLRAREAAESSALQSHFSRPVPAASHNLRQGP